MVGAAHSDPWETTSNPSTKVRLGKRGSQEEVPGRLRWVMIGRRECGCVGSQPGNGSGGSIPEKGAWGEFHSGRVSFEEPAGYPGRASHEELARHTPVHSIHGARTEVTLARGRVPGQATPARRPGRGQGPTPAPSLPEMQKPPGSRLYE